jgi:hypothetical protein
MVFGPVGLASEIYKRARRLSGLLSPERSEPLTYDEVNTAIDSCIDDINYLTWLYSLLILATGYSGHADSKDAPDYIGNTLTPEEELREQQDD